MKLICSQDFLASLGVQIHVSDFVCLHCMYHTLIMERFNHFEEISFDQMSLS